MNLKEKTVVIDNKTYRYSKIVMLPTKNTVGLGDIFKMIDINIFLDDNKDFIGKLFLNVNPLVTKSNKIFEAQHLYFLSSDKIYKEIIKAKIYKDFNIID